MGPVGIVTSGAYHTCAMGLDRNGYCWGVHDQGQVGMEVVTGIEDFHVTPQVLEVGDDPASQVVDIDAGSSHTCAVRNTPLHSMCWGDDDWGQLAVGNQSDYDFPVVAQLEPSEPEPNPGIQ